MRTWKHTLRDSVSQIALRAWKVFGNVEKRVPAHLAESIMRGIRSTTMHWSLYYSVGPTFSTHSHKKTAEKCQSYLKIKRGAVGGINSQVIRMGCSIVSRLTMAAVIWIPNGWDSYMRNPNTAVMFFHRHPTVVGMFWSNSDLWNSASPSFILIRKLQKRSWDVATNFKPSLSKK